MNLENELAEESYGSAPTYANAPQLKRGRQARATGRQGPHDEVKPLRAVLYLRVSSKRQVSTDFDPEGISLPAQRLACEQKAQQQGFEIVDEYVEPGRTGTEMSKRVAFQQMLARIREQRDVDVVLVYKLSRLHRNRYDEANTMMTLQQHDVILVSATEQIDATPVGQLMQGILSSFNQYRSAEDGADIRYKLGEKARKGGTVFRAPLGYENVGVRVEDREVRTVQFDKERAPLVAIAFDLYASGKYSIPALVDELTVRGLTTRATSARPAGPISENQLQRLLQDPYYLGLVRLKDQVYEGRHDALVNGEVFARVQEVIASQSTGERKRTHDHYLKGSLFCGRCFDTDGTVGWMIMANVRGRGGDYQYFFCRRRQEHLCNAPYIQLPRLEDAVVRFWRRQQVTEAFSKALREGIHRTVDNDQRATRSLHKQVSANLKKLDTQEQNLLDLAADGLVPRATIQKRITAITKQRAIMTAQLEDVERKLADVLDYIDAALSLLERPGEVYANATDEIRRLMNQALFRRIYVEVDEVTGAELNAPFDALLAADVAFQQQSTLANGKGASMSDESREILNIALNDISSKRNMVGPVGLEPTTRGLKVRCSAD